MSPNRFKRHTLLGLCVAAAALAAPLAAQAQEITLKAVNAFQEGTYYARNFERFVKKVNDEGKGLIQINYIGGPKAIPTFEQGNALRSSALSFSSDAAPSPTSASPSMRGVGCGASPALNLRRPRKP